VQSGQAKATAGWAAHVSVSLWANFGPWSVFIFSGSVGNQLAFPVRWKQILLFGPGSFKVSQISPFPFRNIFVIHPN
jgi:hypothetical protein